MSGRVVRWMLASAILFAGASAVGGEHTIKATARVDGKKPAGAVRLRALGRNVANTRLKTDAAGDFSIELAETGNDVTVWPNNYTCFIMDGVRFLVGYARCKDARVEKLELKLRSLAMKSHRFQIVDQHGKPVPNAAVKFYASIPMGIAKGAPKWKEGYNLASDRKGFVEFRTAPVKGAEYSIKIDSFLVDSSRVRGRIALAPKDLSGGGEGTRKLRVNRVQLSLKITVKWDPDYTDKAFVADRTLIDRHVVALKEVAKSRVMLREDGTAKFYGLKPGKYTLVFSEDRDRAYRIVRKTEAVEVAKDAKLPVEYVVLVRPITVQEFRGRLVDEKSRKPVAGARVSCGPCSATSDKHGAFTLKVSPTGSARASTRHAGYYPGRFFIPVKFSSTVPVDFKLKPLPWFRGKLVDGASKKPVPGVSIVLKGRAGYEGKARTDRLGRVGIQAPVGTYVLQARGVRGKTGPGTGSRFLLCSIPVTVATGGTEKEITVPPVTAVTLTVSVDKAAGEDRDVAAVCLVRPSDGLLVTVAYVKGGKLEKIYLVEGTYEVVALRNEKEGSSCGRIEVKVGKAIKFSVQLKKWGRFELSKSGHVRVKP